MRRIRLMVMRSDETVAKFDLAIEQEDGSEYKAGPDDLVELFLQEDAVMRLYIRDGKSMAEEDVATVMRWIHYRYVREMQLLEELLPAEDEAVH